MRWFEADVAVQIASLEGGFSPEKSFAYDGIFSDWILAQLNGIREVIENEIENA